MNPPADRSTTPPAELADLTEVAELEALADRIRSAADRGQILDDAVATVARVLDCPLVEVLQLAPDGGTHVLRAGVGLPSDLIGRPRVPASAAGASQTTHQGARSAGGVGPEVTVDEDGLRGVRVVIPGARGPFGLLGVGAESPRAFSSHEVAFLRMVANLLANGVERLLLRAELDALRQTLPAVEPEASIRSWRAGELSGPRLELQPQLAQSQKLEAVGELAGGVAHDFNNLLTVVLGYVEILLEEVDRDSPLRGDLEGISRAAERAAALVHQLLAFSRRQMLQPVVFDLNTTLQSLQSMLHRLIGEDVTLIVRTCDEPAHIRADQSQIEQVVVNLAINARDAMPHGGTITVETTTVGLPARGAPESDGDPHNGYVILTVADTGVGMDPETLSHCFEPFFTTKDPGRGTGLGLATAFGIVRQSEGDIWAESEPGAGTTFTLQFPRLNARTLDVPVSSTPDIVRTGSETVLLVEDEEEVRWLARRALIGAGYRVLEAANGVEALDVAHGHQGTIHLLVTDVVMPELGGVELANRLQLEQRVGGVLFVSGYLDRATEGEGCGIAGEQLLVKPFRADDLLGRVRHTLDG